MLKPGYLHPSHTHQASGQAQSTPEGEGSSLGTTPEFMFSVLRSSLLPGTLFGESGFIPTYSLPVCCFVNYTPLKSLKKENELSLDPVWLTGGCAQTEPGDSHPHMAICFPKREGKFIHKYTVTRVVI